MAYLPIPNQSVSGEVNVKQTTNPWIIKGSVQATAAANQSVSGQVDAVIIGGSITTVGGSTGNSSVQVLNFPSNQSVSGNVGIVGTPSISGTIDIGTIPGSVVAYPTGNQSVSGSVGIAGTPSISGAVTIVGSSSITTLQGTNPWLIGNSSVVVLGTPSISGAVTIVGTPSISGAVTIVGSSSITALQGTNPWMINVPTPSFVSYQLAGSTLAVSGSFSGGNSSVQVLNFPSNQSVSGTMFSEIIGSVATVGTAAANQSVSGDVGIVGKPSISGAVTVVGTPSISGAVTVIGNPSISGTVNIAGATIPPCSVSGSVGIVGTPSISGAVTIVGSSSIATLQGTNPWMVNVPTPSYLSYQAAGSILATTATINNPNSSVMLTASTNHSVVGVLLNSSVAALQGTSPWLITGSVASRVITGVSSVYLQAGVNPIGSVATLQGTDPWKVNVPTPSYLSYQVAGSIMAVSGTTFTAGSVATVFTPSSVVSGHGSVNGAASVLVIPSVGAGLYTYITDFLLSNTGAATTLVTFTDSDGSIMGKSIAPTGGGAVATAISTPMRTYATNKDVYVGATTATSTLHAWVGGYKAT